jgi:hypothetical protein
MKKLWIYAVITAFVGTLSGCLDDDNNYDYEKVNEVQGSMENFDNFDRNYSIISGGELLLEPTFKFTIDSINPDVSYEWYLDRKLLREETGPTYTFTSNKSGTYEVTFSVKDNKSGIKFSRSTSILVRSIYQRGWTILSDEGGRSVLHFIIPQTYKYETTFEGKKISRDSLVYHLVRRDIVPDLGTNPVGLMENIGDMDYSNSYGIQVYDELVVKQDKWAELNGNTLEREVYTEQEFGDELPADFAPVEATMTSSAKALRDENGLIYWMNKSDVTDFHSGFYTSVGLNNNTRFSRLFEAYKFNDSHTNVFLALTEDNSFVGILDRGYAFRGTTITEASSASSGNMYSIIGTENAKFANIEKAVLDVCPVPYHEWDITATKAYWVALLKDKSNKYDLWTFGLKSENSTSVTCFSFYDKTFDKSISDYRNMAAFGINRYVVIADGNQLYYYQYGTDLQTGEPYKGNLIALGNPFNSKIKAVSSFDLINYVANTYQYPYNGQLGVALEDGTFYIFDIKETKNKETGACTAVEMTQVFPNETAPDNNFGKIVDVLYKYGRGREYLDLTF